MENRQLHLRGMSFVIALLLAAISCGPATAQSGGGAELAGSGSELDIFPNLSLGNLGEANREPATVKAAYTRRPAEPGEAPQGVVSVTAKIQPTWHVYSVTQAAGGPTPTRISVTAPAGVKLLGDFKPDVAAKRTAYDAWPGLPIEEHADQVTWSAPVSLPAGFDGAIEVRFSALVCKTDGSCIPLNTKLQAKAKADAAVTASTAVNPAAASQPIPAATAAAKDDGAKSFRDESSVVQWTGKITPADAAPGSRVTLQLTAKPDAGFHVYAAAVDDSESRTNFVITDKAGLKFGAPQAPTKPITKSILPGLPPVQYHAGEISWSIPIDIAADVAAGAKQISGLIGYQACTDTSCLQPLALRFTAKLEVSPAANGAAAEAGAVRFEAAKRATVMDAAAETDWVDASVTPEPAAAEDDDNAAAAPTAAGHAAQRQDTGARAAVPLSLLAILGLGLVGGLILNLMPCVLPVVGLKIMSFASQAGQDRGKVLALNIAYTLGILIVFWALAALAIVSTYSWGREFLGIDGQLAWGEQFQFFEFRYGVILLVFALALSFLGVWEIPIPGFVGGRSTQDLQRKEGFSGAFFKGIFTTVLATPCSGPLLGTVFAYTLGKSAWVILAIFSSIGLGMALPYLLVAVFPRLIVFLPKPGAWMDTFKQLLGFLLLGTVVFIYTFFPADDLVLVFASLIGVWFGCWIIGRVPNWETLPKRLAAWVGGVGAAAAACFLAIWATTPGPVVVAWEPYDEARLQQLQSAGQTVLVDFTASWCPTCIVNYHVALNTEETGRLVKELNAVPMLADLSDHDEVIRAKLQELNSNSIPLLAIYPGRDPENPIVLRDLVSQGQVLTALRQAGRSIAAPPSSLAEHVTHDRNR